MSAHDQPFQFRSIALPAILPTLAFSIGEGAIIPIIPIVAHNLGAQLAVAGLIAAMLRVGELFGDVPSGGVVNRIGERAAMIYASLLSIVGLVLAIFADNPWLLGVGILLVGVATAVFALARHTFMTMFVPYAFRARALSLLGGSFRLGLFIGPFLAAAVIHLSSSTQSAFWVHVGGCLLAATILLVMKDPTATFQRRQTLMDPRTGDAPAAQANQGLFHTIFAHRAALARLGTGAALIGAVRASRTLIVPLWAVSIGISDTNTVLIIGVAGAIDFALFYLSGQIMDRFGRLWSAIPSMVGLGLGQLALAFTHGLPGEVAWFISITIVLAVANGFGSGLLMTLGADLADKSNPAPFLGAWRFTSDAGAAASPLALAGLTALVSLPFAGAMMGVVGLAGAAVLWRYIPRFVPRAR